MRVRRIAQCGVSTMPSWCHNPRIGKTMLAERIPTILPRLDTAAALEVTAILSVAGTLPPHIPLLTNPPLLAPHHTVTKSAIVGGGRRVHLPRSAPPAPPRVPLLPPRPSPATPAL